MRIVNSDSRGFKKCIFWSLPAFYCLQWKSRKMPCVVPTVHSTQIFEKITFLFFPFSLLISFLLHELSFWARNFDRVPKKKPWPTSHASFIFPHEIRINREKQDSRKTYFSPPPPRREKFDLPHPRFDLEFRNSHTPPPFPAKRFNNNDDNNNVQSCENNLLGGRFSISNFHYLCFFSCVNSCVSGVPEFGKCVCCLISPCTELEKHGFSRKTNSIYILNIVGFGCCPQFSPISNWKIQLGTKSVKNKSKRVYYVGGLLSVVV